MELDKSSLKYQTGLIEISQGRLHPQFDNRNLTNSNSSGSIKWSGNRVLFFLYQTRCRQLHFQYFEY